MTDDKPVKRPVGRPTKYKPEYCERVIEMATEGASMAEYAAEFGIDRTTLFDWRDQHEEFSTALARAKVLEQAWFEREARMNMRNKEFNSNLWYRSALSRFRDDYAEKKITELSGPNGGAVKIEASTVDVGALEPDQRDALKQLLLAAKESK